MFLSFLHCCQAFLLPLASSSCLWKKKGVEVCEGAVIKELKSKVKICENGKLKFKSKTEVAPGYPLGGRECKWKGELICDGQTVEVSRHCEHLPSEASCMVTN